MSTQVITATLPSEVIYVTGTVNGTAYTWTLMGTAWTATVERADNDTYQVELTAVTAAGSSAQYSLTLYYGVLNLITDRTAADVAAVNAKGTYNAADLNRVGAAVAYLAGLLTGYGYHAPVSPRQDWQESDVPTESDMERYLRDIATLRGALATLPGTPDVPSSMKKLTYTKANDIEQILVNLDAVIRLLRQAWYYSGEVYAGDV